MKRRFHDPALEQLAQLAASLDATMFILAALAAAAGIARAVSGIHSAQKQGQSERDLIKRAYQISKQRMNQSEAYTRQGTNESLNARGVLSGGADSARSPAVASAYSAGAASAAANAKIKSTKDVFGMVHQLAKAGGGPAQRALGTEQARMAADSERGQSGDASTIGGQVNTDLSSQNYLEQQDLFSQRAQGITASKRDQSAATVGAIGAGIETGASVYNAGSMIAGAFGATPTGAATPAPTAGQPGYQPPSAALVKPGSWFGGYDPTDPLGLKKAKTNDLFNANSK